MDFVETYNECKKIYANIYNVVRDAFFYYQNEKRGEVLLSEADDLSDSFEIIFQYSMLQIISSCGKMSEMESHIIKDIVVEKDLVAYIQEYKPNAYDWDDLEKLSQDNLINYVNDNLGLVKALTIDFVPKFSKSLYSYNKVNKQYNINFLAMQLTNFTMNILNVDNDSQRRSYDNNLILEIFGKVRNEVNNLRREELYNK